MERVSSMVDKCSHHETPFEQTIFTLDDFEKIDTLANVALGSVALGYFRPRAHEHEHVHDDDDDLDHNKLHNVELARAAGEEQSSLHFSPVISGDATRLHQKNGHSTSHHTVYVLKLISKVSVYRQNQANRIITEASILSTLKHPFICRLYGKFQTPKDLVLVLERVSGGDLWSVMYEASDAPRVARLGGSYLSLDLVRFYIASLILALEFMHKKDIAYRNLKPENVLIDDRGYVRLVGFGFAKKYPFIDASGEHQHRSFTFCGTLGKTSQIFKFEGFSIIAILEFIFLHRA
jgi:serine/threonine protein kinase